MKTLHLTLKKRWFNLIATGEKVIEYREAKPYWRTRLQHQNGRMKHFDEIFFRNGYGKEAPFMRVTFLTCIITHSCFCCPKNGETLAEGPVFVIALGRIIEKGLIGDE